MPVRCQMSITQYQRYKRRYDVKIERNRENLNYRQARKNSKSYYPRQLVPTFSISRDIVEIPLFHQISDAGFNYNSESLAEYFVNDEGTEATARLDPPN